MSEAYDEGYEAFIAGESFFSCPYNYVDGHDMHPQEYYDWYRGWHTGADKFGDSRA
jgi:ribosome modulation factor